MKVPQRLLIIFFAAVLIMSASKVQASSQPYIFDHQINFGTGNKYLSATDVSLAGPVGTLHFTRTYNSQGDSTSVVGYGWSANHTERLIIATDTINQVQRDGRYVRFKNDGSDNWINQTGRKLVINANADGYQLKEPNGTIKQYDSTGNLVTITDRNNNTQTYIYSNGLVSSISDNFGRSLLFTYTSGKLTKVTSVLGAWTYSYLNDNLVKVGKPDGTNIQYIYDDPNFAHNLTGIIDESGIRILTITYDTLNRVTSSAKANGEDKVTIAYPTVSTREVTNSLGEKTTYNLNILNGVAMVGSMAGPGCLSCGGNANTNYVYDDRFQTTQATDANGVKTTYTYDASGNTTSISKAFGTPLASTTTKTYTVFNQVATISRPSVANPGQQVVTSMTYDTKGNLLTKQQSGYSGTTAITRLSKYTYNTYGQITSIDGPRTDVNDVVSFAYYANTATQGNNRGNLYTIKNALGHTTTFSAYNAFGQATTIKDPNGIVTTRVFNTNGVLTSTTTAGLTTNYTYDITGKLQKITLPGSRTITYSYSPAGQVTKIIDSLGNSVNYTYDSEGQLTSEKIHDPQNALTRYANYGYDAYGRQNKITYPGPAQETSAYDAVGNLLQTINATSMQTGYQYDALNRLLSVTEAGTLTAGYTYDAHGNVTTVTDAKGKVTSFTYDDFSRKVTGTAPDTGKTVYGYDPAGNLVSVTDANKQVVGYTYDALNRPVSQSYAGTGGDIVFAYDQGTKAIERLSKVTDREGTDSFAYDTAGRLAMETRVIGGKSYTIGYTWNNTNGYLAGMTYPSGLKVTYTRDKNGQITGIINADGVPLISKVSYLPFGPLKAASLGSVSLIRAYDQRYNVTEIKAGNSFDFVYTRDPGGHVTSIANNKTPVVTMGTTAYNYNTANNQLTGHTGTTPKAYTYDANGNIVSDGALTFVYDGLNRMVQVNKQAATVATYGYDSSNRRIRKTIGTVTTHYLYDLNSQLIAEALLDGTILREYIYLNGEPLALKEYKTNPGIYYFVNDHLGTPQQLVNTTGTVVWQAAYLPFGQAQVTIGTVTNDLRLPGQYHDSETGLHYNWHRYYDPDTGRYLTPDPIGMAGGINLFVYTENNPINFFDPLGLQGSQWNIINSMDNLHNGWKPPRIYPPNQPLPGYNWCGSGNNGFTPTCPLDEACKEHDECYKKCKLDSSDVSLFCPGQDKGPSCQDKCDDNLCDAAGIHGGWIRIGVKYLFCD